MVLPWWCWGRNNRAVVASSRKYRAALRHAVWLPASVLLVLHARLFAFVTDDAYISFVYARNLAEHGELVFNLGDRVEGYSNFLWTVLLALGIKVGVSPEVSSQVLSIGFAIGTLIVATRLVQRLAAPGPMLLALAPILLAASSSFACWATGGLETHFFTFFVILAIDREIAARESARNSICVGAAVALAKAQNIREMHETGDLWTLRWQGQASLQRPTTPFLPVAAISAVVPGEHGLRLFPGLCFLATLLVCYGIARTLDVRRDSAFVAVLLAVSFPGFAFFGRSLLSDPPFVLAITAALWAVVAGLRGRPNGLFWAAIALGGAIAVKSLAAAVPIVALAPWLVVLLRRNPSRRRLLAATAVVAAIALPYYVGSYILHGTEFLEQHFGRTLVDRAAGDLEVGLPGGIFAYAGYLARGEGIVAIVLLLLGTLGGFALGRRDGNHALVAVSLFSPVVFVLFSFIGTRLPHYLLPIYPAAGIAAAAVLESLRKQVHDVTATRALVVVVAISTSLAAVASPPEEQLMPSPQAVEIGLRAKDVPDVKAGAPLYSLEWYAPAAAYYAERPWVLLTESEGLFEMMESIHFLREADVTQLVPPWPDVDSGLLLAVPQELMVGLPYPHRIVGESDGFALVVLGPE